MLWACIVNASREPRRRKDMIVKSGISFSLVRSCFPRPQGKVNRVAAADAAAAAAAAAAATC